MSLRRQADKIDIHHVNNEAARSITFHKRVGIDLSRGEYKDTCLSFFLFPFFPIFMHGISADAIGRIHGFCLHKYTIFFSPLSA